MPVFKRLLATGAAGNVAVQVGNRLVDGYGTLGAGQKSQLDPQAAWAFNNDEKVRGAPASELFERLNGRPPAGTVAVALRRNTPGSFPATPGLLGRELARAGKATAVLGNADRALGPLPSALRSPYPNDPTKGADNGIHREAALAAMDAGGQVGAGDVSRGLLRSDPSASFGLATSPEQLTAAFTKVWAESDLVIVETGDTARADADSLKLPPEQRAGARKAGLRLAGGLAGRLLAQIDVRSTLVIVVAPTTPGGPLARGELRPVMVAGPGIQRGLLTSASTRRAGLVSMPDLTATIANFLGAGGERFAEGRPVRLVASQVASYDPVGKLTDMNQRATSHDRSRAPITIIILGIHLLIYIAALMKLRSAPLSRLMIVLVLSGLAFPLASFISGGYVWRAGPWVAGISIAAGSLLLALVASACGKRSPLGASLAILSGTLAFFVADLAAGGQSQLDSTLGYSSIVAGRFFGIGNLGFAIIAASALLVAGMVSDLSPGRGKWLAFAIIAAAVVADGHPQLGNDVGGTLALVPAGACFALALTKRAKPKSKIRIAQTVLVIAAAAMGAVLIFGLFDLARPPAFRTHLGDFLSIGSNDPGRIFFILKRRVTLAAGLAAGTYWTLPALAAAVVLVYLDRRSPYPLRTQLENRRGLKAGAQAVLVAGLIGSLVNDSGIAVAGMMLAVAAPWTIIVSSKIQEMALESSRTGREP
ncbi:MAG: hypothetical protein ACR2FO_04805 [Actinomycetota bacterium]